jgi:bifunctional enzyme CysN/CysC
MPTDALHGDNVVQRSSRMPWYQGPALLYQLEHLHAASDRNLVEVRFPVQLIVRPRHANTAHHDFRGYAGRIASGVMKSGDRVLVLPSHVETVIHSIETFDGPVSEAFPPMSVTIRTANDLDIARGDMLVRPHNRPSVLRDIEAMVCVVGETEIEAGREFLLQHTTRVVRCRIEELRYTVDIDSLHRREEARTLSLNDIGRVHIRMADPIFCDPYHQNMTTGTFILIDRASDATVAAGIVLPRATEQQPSSHAPGVPAEASQAE